VVGAGAAEVVDVGIGVTAAGVTVIGSVLLDRGGFMEVSMVVVGIAVVGAGSVSAAVSILSM
jgi:hypothetical protein